ncbi:MAG TPA: hypothetical protein VHF22_14165 [Planctomycetota bacterium]|nr:hypothetical protein [Planctomycetota bacterium]
MAHAYTPGLRVAKRTVVRRERALPMKGNVVVKEGALVKAEEVVAETHLPGDVESVNVVNRLGITPAEIKTYMLKGEGDDVAQGEPIARAKSFFGLFKTEIPSPITGKIETVSTVTGQVLLRKPPRPVSVKAFIDGKVVAVREAEGVTVECTGTFVQGIFGVGPETSGELAIAVASKSEPLTADKLKPEHKGKIVVGGSLVPFDAIEAARKIGVAGIVAGGLHDEDLKRLLGYDLGVAITGQEPIGITVVVTEGFGAIDMADRTFNLLKSRAGHKCSLSGATQIRAGVIRPEIIVPFDDAGKGEAFHEPERAGMKPGDAIRCIRSPYFGRIGRVKALPSELRAVESETHVRVLEVELDGGGDVVLPRANIEVIEE